MKIESNIREKIVIGFILIIAAVLYLGFMFHDTLSPDEALYAWNAKQLSENHSLLFSLNTWQNDPLFLIVIQIFDLFFLQELACRLAALMFGVLGIFFIYLLGRELKGTTLGLLSALFLTLNPWYWMMSERILLDVPLTTMIILNSHFLLKCYKTKNTPFLFLSIFSIILVILTKSVGVMMLPFNILILSYVYLTREKIRNNWFWYIALIIVICGNLVWILQDELTYILHSFSLARLHENYTVANNIFDILFGYVPSQFYVLLYVLLFIFILHLGYMVTKTKDKFPYAFLIMWIMSVFMFRLLFGGGTVIRYVLPSVPALILLIVLTLGDSVNYVKREYNINMRVLKGVIIVITFLISFGLLLQGIQISKFTSYSKTGFKEAGNWLHENVEPETSIIYSGSPYQIRYYSDFDCGPENRTLACFYNTNIGIPQKLYRIVEETDKTLYLQIDFREKFQPDWIKDMEHADYLKSLGFNVVYVVTKKQPFYISAPTQSKTTFLEEFNITPYQIYPGKNIIFPTGIEAYAGILDGGEYLEELGFKRASTIQDYVHFALTIEDTYIDQPVVLIFKRDPVTQTDNQTNIPK